MSIQFSDEESPDLSKKTVVRVKRVISINSLQSIEHHFRKELMKMDFNDIIEANVDIEGLVSMIKTLVPNLVVIKNEVGGVKTFIGIETEVSIGDFIAIRGSKIIGSGSLEDCRLIILDKLNAEHPGKFKRMRHDELDEIGLKNISNMYYSGNSTKFRIIKTK